MRCAILFLLLFPVLASADIFKCKENGHTTYSATPCAAGAVVADYDASRTTFTEASGASTVSIARDSAGHYVARGVRFCCTDLCRQVVVKWPAHMLHRRAGRRGVHPLRPDRAPPQLRRISEPDNLDGMDA